MATSSLYVWSQPDWPAFTFSQAALTDALGRARLAQGTVHGLAQAIGLAHHPEILHDIWVGEAMATAGIEGEKLNLDAVRSSVLRKIGGARRGISSKHVDGLVDVMDDATRNYGKKLTHPRLCNWQAALFPTGRSGLARIEVGAYRTHTDPMQIVSGRLGKEKVHYVAPPSAKVHAEMTRFLAWFRDSAPGGKIVIDGVARAAITHLWFETIHPFEDGNGRLGRALCDLVLAQDSNAPSRLYSYPRTRFVADFIGTCNLLTGPVQSCADGLITLAVEHLGTVKVACTNAVDAGSTGAVALRPEKIRLQAADTAMTEDNQFRGVVSDFLYQGDVTVYIITTDGGARIEALLANSAAGRTKFFEVGDAVALGWPTAAGHFVAE